MNIVSPDKGTNIISSRLCYNIEKLKTKMKILTSKQKHVKFLRYPGGKQRMLTFLLPLLPTPAEIKGSYYEPFLGGGAGILFFKSYESSFIGSK